MTTSTHSFAALLLGYIAGINKRLAGQTLEFNETTYTDKQLIAIFQPCADAAAAAAQADAQRTTAVGKAQAAMAATRPVAKGFRQAVLLKFGENAAALADFDLQPRKVTAPSTKTKAAAAAKAKATRIALGTKGSKQKKAAKKALAESAATAAPTPATPATAAMPEPATPPALPPAATPTPTPAKQ